METSIKVRKASDQIALSPFTEFILSNWPKNKNRNLEINRLSQIKIVNGTLVFTPIEPKW